nr:MAG TPA: hypothetical protein [Caudoviricetes sp.]
MHIRTFAYLKRTQWRDDELTSACRPSYIESWSAYARLIALVRRARCASYFCVYMRVWWLRLRLLPPLTMMRTTSRPPLSAWPPLCALLLTQRLPCATTEGGLNNISEDYG